MQKVQFTTIGEAKEALTEDYEIAQAVIDELFESVAEAAESLVSKYSIEDDVDIELMEEYLKIGFCEHLVLFLNEGALEGEDDVYELVENVRNDPVANATTVSGRVATRHPDLMTLSEAILADKNRVEVQSASRSLHQ